MAGPKAIPLIFSLADRSLRNPKFGFMPYSNCVSSFPDVLSSDGKEKFPGRCLGAAPPPKAGCTVRLLQRLGKHHNDLVAENQVSLSDCEGWRSPCLGRIWLWSSHS